MYIFRTITQNILILFCFLLSYDSCLIKWHEQEFSSTGEIIINSVTMSQVKETLNNFDGS